jgi:hypothetical protein
VVSDKQLIQSWKDANLMAQAGANETGVPHVVRSVKAGYVAEKLTEDALVNDVGIAIYHPEVTEKRATLVFLLPDYLNGKSAHGDGFVIRVTGKSLGPMIQDGRIKLRQKLWHSELELQYLLDLELLAVFEGHVTPMTYTPDEEGYISV